MDYSPPGSSVHGIFQARICGLPYAPPGNLPGPDVIKLMSPASPTLASGFFTTEPPGKQEEIYQDEKKKNPPFPGAQCQAQFRLREFWAV